MRSVLYSKSNITHLFENQYHRGIFNLLFLREVLKSFIRGSWVGENLYIFHLEIFMNKYDLKMHKKWTIKEGRYG